jgi:light-regulated signal transduction histidine kinase (bacteriophytochrome)
MPENVLEEKPQIVSFENGARLLSHDRCAQEPVQIIGRIQSHGLLFAVSEPDLIVRQVSANVLAFLGRSPDSLLAQPLEGVLGTKQFEMFRAQVATGGPLTAMQVQVPAGARTLEMDCVAHRQDGVLIVELELAEGAHSIKPLDIDAHIRIPLSRMEGSPDVLELVRLAADEIRQLSSFNRVMVYRFDEDWNGEVVAGCVSLPAIFRRKCAASS